MRLWRPRALRRRLSLLVVVAHGAALALAVLCLWAVLGHALSDEASQAARARSAVEVSQLPVPTARLARATEDLPGEGETWLVIGGRAAQTPRVAPAITRAALLAAARPGRISDGTGPTRFYAARLTYQGNPWGVVVTGVPLAPYDATLNDILLVAIATAAVIVLTVGFAVERVVGRALRPVTEMTSKAAAWSVKDPGRRFGAGPAYDEISQLASTLDLLLDRIAAVLRAERLFTAEVAHELRGPLAAMRSEAELALRRKRSSCDHRKTIEAMLGSLTRLSYAVDSLVALAAQRTPAERGRCHVEDVFDELLQSCTPLAASRGTTLFIKECDATLVIGAQPDIVFHLLHPVVENACQHARSSVSLSADGDGGSCVRVEVDDDGCGVAAADVERIFEPGQRGTATAGVRHDGAGLGLALARRLANSLDGEISAEAGCDGGRFVVKLPAG